MAKEKPTIKIQDHVSVPKHEKISLKEKKELYDKFKLTIKEVPKILATDPAIADMGLEEGDVLKITRKSPTAGTILYYRVVCGK